MTPFAQKVLNQTLALPVLPPPNTIGWALMQPEMRCFEVSAVLDAATNLFKDGDEAYKEAEKGGRTFNYSAKAEAKIRSTAGEMLFLPSNLTWIEWKRSANDLRRVALCLMEQSGYIAVIILNSHREQPIATFCFRPRDQALHIENLEGEIDIDWASAYTTRLIALLAFINSPKIIGRREHPPHIGLQRKVARAQGKSGKAALRPWTEIKLSVTPPIRDTGNEDSEPTLTGAKALHFCRAHLRIRLGKLEMVRGHWRGDPALGIVQSRYKVVA